MLRFLRPLGRFAAYIFAGVLVIALIWFAANRLFDEKPDPLRVAFVSPPEEPLSDDQNIAVGILGLGAPRGTDFLKFGAHMKDLYDRRVPSAEIQRSFTAPMSCASALRTMKSTAGWTLRTTDPRVVYRSNAHPKY